MKSIKGKLMGSIIASVVIVALVIGGLGIVTTWNSTMGAVQKSLAQSVQQGASVLEHEIENYKLMAEDIGCIARMARPDTPLEQKAAISAERQKMYDLKNLFIVDGAGQATSSLSNTSENISGEPYFQQAIKGNCVISEPRLNKADGSMEVLATAPLWEEGVYGSKIVGAVVLVFDGDKLSEMVKKMTIGETGSAFVVDKNATTIAHGDQNRVVQQENIITAAKGNPDLAALAEMEQRMIKGETGVLGYEFGGTKKIAAYAPINATNGWSIAITVAEVEFMKEAEDGNLMMMVLVVVAIILAGLFARRISKSIATPISKCTARLALLAQGDLTSPIPEIHTKDETGALAEATQSIVTTLGEIIRDEDYLLSAMAKGNFAIRTKVEDRYVGDFQEILMSMRKINSHLSDTLISINEAADQVAGGAGQVSDSALALSQGATEQASSSEELSATIAEIAQQIKQNAQNAQVANTQSVEAGAGVVASNEKMQQMIKAMAHISKKSDEISKIIKTIDDIAFQTNILALNAAVEAARAGEAGKGFAVVADEVRNLAGKSAEAAKSTTAMIEESIKAVAYGTTVADETAQTLLAVVDSTQNVTELVEKIAKDSDEQAIAISQVTMGVEQIAAVVQTNSATAEQSAAASQELSGQAQMLKELVDQFTLKKNA